MSVWEFLTKPRGLGSAAFRWNEPWLFRIRLRGDLGSRIAILLASWGLATGVLLILFAINLNPPGILLALGLGAVFGLGPAWLAVFFRSGHTSGRVTVGNDELSRQRHYASLTAQWVEWAEWPYESIQLCMLVSGKNLGHSFSVILLSDATTREIVAVPASIDLLQLGNHFKSRGVHLTQGKTISVEFTRPLAAAVVIVAAVAGCIAFAAGLTYYLTKVH